MGVYVDNALIPAEVQNGRVTHRSRWSHLLADTPRELHDFATRVLGLQRSYFQDKWPHPYYDLTEGKRAQALARGAQPIDRREAPEVGRWLPPVLVTASRDGIEVADVEAALKPHFDPRRVLVAGGARGGDRIAQSLWQAWGGEIDQHQVSPAAWERSRGVGYERNAKMVTKVRARGGECVAIVARCMEPRCTRQEPHGTHGASHCADLAKQAGIPVDAAFVGGKPSGWQPKAEPEAEAGRHNWRRTEDPDRKQCECEVTAVRARNPGGKGWTVTFHVPGLPPTTEVPPCFGPQHELAPVAGPAAKPTHEPPAGRQSDIQEGPPRPGRPVRIGPVAAAAVPCGECGTEFFRPAGETYEACLSCQTAERLRASGIKPDDPGLTGIKEWNRQVTTRVARQAESEPGRAGGPVSEPEPEPQPGSGFELEPDAGR
jgi:hypothetical protein